jgi:hypothetical protein
MILITGANGQLGTKRVLEHKKSTQRYTVERSTVSPLSSIISSKLRYPLSYRRYHRTHNRMMSD